VNEHEKGIRGYLQSGLPRVSIKPTERHLTVKDSRNLWTNESLLQMFVDLKNLVLKRFTVEWWRNIRIHTGRDVDCNSLTTSFSLHSSRLM